MYNLDDLDSEEARIQRMEDLRERLTTEPFSVIHLSEQEREDLISALTIAGGL